MTNPDKTARRPWRFFSIDETADGRGSKARLHRRWFFTSADDRIDGHVELVVLGGEYRFGWGFQFGRNGSDSDVGLDLHAGRLGNLYLRLRSPWTSWLNIPQGRPDWASARHTGITVLPGDGVWIRGTFEDVDGHWRSGQPWWRAWSFGRVDVLGRSKMTTLQVDGGRTSVPMPEGVYQATWNEVSTVTRHKRWPGTWVDAVRGPGRHRYFTVEVEGGIPVQGKGEDSWNCGMDGLFSCSGPTLEAAIGNMVAAALRGRRRYGGPHDLPRPMSVTEAAEAHV